MSEIVEIVALGADGDGVARSGTENIHVPFTLPGETARIARHGRTVRLLELVQRSPLRVAPPCRHFGSCGGCQMQHFDAEAYCEWKADRVAVALRQRGIDAPVQPMLRCPPGARRRATFTARRVEGRIIVGFNESGSHRLVELAECPVLRPEIVARLPQLHAIAEAVGVSGKPLRMAVTLTETGLDLDLSGIQSISESRRQRLVRLALDFRLARLTLAGEIIVEPAKPMLDVGKAVLSPPPGAFLQATAEAEAAMAGQVGEYLAGCRRIADLFAGSGAFALRLAEFASVHAVDSEAAPLAALDRAFRSGRGLRPITTERRDLFRRPLTVAELKPFAGIVFDPPRAGAEAQALAIAASTVRKVAAVSCNPATLARDLAILVGGGYRIISVMPIDQFLWSPHVEVVALLTR